MAGGLDLRRPERTPSGHRHRRRRPQAVPLPRAVARAPRPGEIRADDPLRAALPKLRRRVAKELGTPGPSRDRVLACALRLLDVGLFRVGGEEYADEDSGIGLATVRREHVSFETGRCVFDYPAKGGVRASTIRDPPARSSSALWAAARGRAELLAYRKGRQVGGIRATTSAPTSRSSSATSSARRTSAPGTQPCWPRPRSPARNAGASKTARKRAITRRSSEVATCSATRPRSPAARTSIRACSTAFGPAGRLPARLSGSAVSTPSMVGAAAGSNVPCSTCSRGTSTPAASIATRLLAAAQQAVRENCRRSGHGGGGESSHSSRAEAHDALGRGLPDRLERSAHALRPSWSIRSSRSSSCPLGIPALVRLLDQQVDVLDDLLRVKIVASSRFRS